VRELASPVLSRDVSVATPDAIVAMPVSRREEGEVGAPAGAG
jgi:hypothetical protein